MSNLLVDRRKMMAAKWEPNIKFYVVYIGGSDTDTRFFAYAIGNMQYMSGGVLKREKVNGYINPFTHNFDTPQYIEFVARTIFPNYHGSSRYGITGAEMRDFYSPKITDQIFKIGNSSSPIILENGSIVASNSSILRYQNHRTVKIKNVTFSIPQNLCLIYNTYHLEMDNITLAASTEIRRDYNNAYQIIRVLNITNLEVLRITGNSGGSGGQTTTGVKEWNFGGCTNLRSLSITFPSQKPTEDVFRAFLNSLPERSSDSRGTLKCNGNHYRASGNTDTFGILSAKNWDYVAFS